MRNVITLKCYYRIKSNEQRGNARYRLSGPQRVNTCGTLFHRGLLKKVCDTLASESYY